MNNLDIPFTDGFEGSIYLREDGSIGIWDGCNDMIIDPSGWKDFVEAVNKMDKLLILK
jgi:hypothetical protein